VDNGIVAHFDVGNVVQADPLDDAAKIHAADAEAAFVEDLFDSSGDGKAHGN
jgi:hypothetical protein